VPGVRVRHGEEAPGQPGVGQPLQGPGGGQQVPGRPRALVAVGAHPEATVDQLLAGRAGPCRSANRRAAEGGEGLGLPPPPVLGDPGRGLPLVAPDHGEHGLTVLWAGRLHMDGAQPGVQRPQGLVGVDHQDTAGPSGQGLQRRGVGRLVQGPSQAGQEPGRRRVEVAPVQPHRRHPGLAGQAGELTEQEGLAHPARAVDIQQGERWLGVGQRRSEQRQLGLPPDEAPPAGGRQPVGEPRPAPGRRGRYRHSSPILRHRGAAGQARGGARRRCPAAGGRPRWARTGAG
jgi:hypothetical protein